MKQKILFLITFITLTNVIYASFPVHENDSIEVIEQMTMQWIVRGDDIYSFLSLLLALFGYFCFFLELDSLRTQSVMILIAWIAAIVLGLIGMSKKKWLSILGLLLGFLGFLILNSFMPFFEIILTGSGH